MFCLVHIMCIFLFDSAFRMACENHSNWLHCWSHSSEFASKPEWILKCYFVINASIFPILVVPVLLFVSNFFFFLLHHFRHRMYNVHYTKNRKAHISQYVTHITEWFSMHSTSVKSSKFNNGTMSTKHTHKNTLEVLYFITSRRLWWVALVALNQEEKKKMLSEYFTLICCVVFLCVSNINFVCHIISAISSLNGMSLRTGRHMSNTLNMWEMCAHRRCASWAHSNSLKP